MTHASILEQQSFASKLRRGAENAVLASLSVNSKDRVVIICDEASLSVGSAMLTIVKEQNAHCDGFILERLAPRPIAELPEPITRAMKQATVSFYLASSLPDEHPHRNRLLELVKFHKVRHAHMMNVDENVMCQGMLTDFRNIAKLNKLMIETINQASKIQVTSQSGTDVTVVLDRLETWHDSAGVIQPGRWENLPNGEILTCPKTVDGVFVCDNIAPTKEHVDSFDLRGTPLKIHMKNGRLENIDGGPENLAMQVMANARAGTNMDRIGMFAVGTNYELLMTIGNRLQDMFVPGAYFSMGRFAAGIAPSWTSSAQHIFHGRKISLILDGKAIIKNGRYDPSIIAGVES